MRKLAVSLLLILGLVLAGACAATSEEMVPSPPMEEGMPGDEANTDRMIVKSGNMTLKVESVVEAMDEVTEIADELGGYVVSSRKYEHDGETSASVSIRVPAERFDDALGMLREIALEVPYESTSGKDVTEEYIDLQSKLRNLEATESQYLELLKRAETVEEILKVQRELSNVRGQIEQTKGRMQYLERTSDMALIEAQLQQSRPLAEPWSASNTFNSAVRGLATFGRALANIAIWLGIFCWVWIPLLVIWLRKRRKAKS